MPTSAKAFDLVYVSTFLSTINLDARPDEIIVLEQDF